MKNLSLESLLKAMETAERRWDEEDTGGLIGYDELPSLRRGDKVTAFQRYASGEWEAYRATVTSVRKHGYTTLDGWWFLTPELTQEPVVRSYVICFKEASSGIRLRYDVTSLKTTKIYRGWSVSLKA